jgi:hypothetical protein
MRGRWFPTTESTARFGVQRGCGGERESGERERERERELKRESLERDLYVRYVYERRER